MSREQVDAGPNETGKYLTFLLAGTEYGVAMPRVEEVNGRFSIASVPQAPDCVRGVTPSRTGVVPVVCLRRLLGLPAVEDSGKTSLVVVQVRHRGETLAVGLVVDEVFEVMHLPAARIENLNPPPAEDAADWAVAIGRLNSRVVIIVDVDRALGDVAIESVTEAAS